MHKKARPRLKGRAMFLPGSLRQAKGNKNIPWSLAARNGSLVAEEFFAVCQPGVMKLPRAQPEQSRAKHGIAAFVAQILRAPPLALS
jgi:hypothetical protein